MIRPLFLAGVFGASGLWGQFAFSVDIGSTRQPVGDLYEVGSLAAGDTGTWIFHIRNVSGKAAILTTLAISGTGFSLAGVPDLPQSLGIDAERDFTVRFQPAAAGSYSAVLRTDGAMAYLHGTAAAALSVFQEGNPKALDSTSLVDFGSVERGSRRSIRFTVRNASSQLLAASLATGGEFFSLVSGGGAVSLAPGESAPLEVAFHPQAAGTASGYLAIGQRHIAFRGTGQDPPPPKAEIVLDPQSAASAATVRAAIRLAAPARATATGRLEIGMRPATAGTPGDPAVMFPLTGGYVATFSIAEGDTEVHFGSQPWIEFQTGTTAGTILLTVQLGNTSTQASLAVAPAPPGVDTAGVTRSVGGLTFRLIGYDNMHAVSKLAFTFFGPDGAPIPPGAITADVAADFQRYFAGSGLGGVFALEVTFPVTGDASRITAVEATLTNPAGSATLRRNF